MTIRRILLALLLTATFCAYGIGSADTTHTAKNKYIPEIGGTLRTFYRLNTNTAESRFEIANARLTVGGYVMPWFDYFFQVDFCQRGKIRFLDAFARFYPAEGLTIYAGQMRVPFSSESSRLPWRYYFADVGLPAFFGNLRSVGVKAGYTIPKTNIYLEGGIFNSSDMTDHGVWNSAMTYAVRLNYTSPIGIKPEISFMSRSGDNTTAYRINMADASISYSTKRIFAEAEYIYRYYGTSTLRAEHAYNIFADYAIPLKSKIFNKISFQGRYDGIAAPDEQWWPTHSRITAGATISRQTGAKLLVAFRINYEHYFYNNSTAFPSSVKNNNELIAGITIHF